MNTTFTSSNIVATLDKLTEAERRAIAQIIRLLNTDNSVTQETASKVFKSLLIERK